LVDVQFRVTLSSSYYCTFVPLTFPSSKANPIFSHRMSSSDLLPILLLDVQTVRVTVHSMPPKARKPPARYNHWSIYLLISGGSSVRLNMELDDVTIREGKFTVSSHLPYRAPRSQCQNFDFAAARDATVGHFVREIMRNNRHRYRMASQGKGCRHWM
jgi:hypothetical protein